MVIAGEKFEYSVVTPGTQGYRDYLALRYKVFCDELKRLSSKCQLPAYFQMESDTYDSHSLHVLCRSLDSGLAVGCSRLILPSPEGLSISARYSILLKTAVPPKRIGEIGRVAISSELRRYRGAHTGTIITPTQLTNLSHLMNKQSGSLVASGLYREIFHLANNHGITNFYAAMEPSLARLLNRNGFPFQIAGPLNTAVYPPRQPYFIGTKAIRKTMSDLDTHLSKFMFKPSYNSPAHAC